MFKKVFNVTFVISGILPSFWKILIKFCSHGQKFNKAHQIKQGDGDFVLQPYERETLTMTVHPEEYLPKTVDYCHFLNRFVVIRVVQFSRKGYKIIKIFD